MQVAQLPSSDAEARLDRTVRDERVRFVYAQSPVPIFVSPFSAAVLSVALWNQAPHRALLVWSVGALIIAMVRLAVLLAFRNRKPGEHEDVKWERWFVISVMMVGLWWGIASLFLLTPNSIGEQAIVFAFVMLMAGGTGASYGAHPRPAILTLIALTAPLTINFALQNDVAHRMLAFAAVIYLLATFRSINVLSYFFVRSNRLAHEIQEARERAEALARTDVLTGMNNRRAFYELGEAALQQSQRYHHPLALMMLDIDHFKSINDRYGHAAGDAVLQAMATIIQQTRRVTDVAGRIGGEEFALLLPETSMEDAVALAERLRAKLGGIALTHSGTELRFTSSFGVAEKKEAEDLDQVIARADAALYQAKQQGRNRVAAAGR